MSCFVGYNSIKFPTNPTDFYLFQGYNYNKKDPILFGNQCFGSPNATAPNMQHAPTQLQLAEPYDEHQPSSARVHLAKPATLLPNRLERVQPQTLHLAADKLQTLVTFQPAFPPAEQPQHQLLFVSHLDRLVENTVQPHLERSHLPLAKGTPFQFVLVVSDGYMIDI